MKKSLYIVAIALSLVLAPLTVYAVTPNLGVTIEKQEVRRGIVESSDSADFAANALAAINVGPVTVSGKTFANWDDKQLDVYRLEGLVKVGTVYENGLFAEGGVIYYRPVNSLEKHDVEVFVAGGFSTGFVTIGADVFYSVVDNKDLYIQPYLQGQALDDQVSLRVSTGFSKYENASFIKDGFEFVEGKLAANVEFFGIKGSPFVSYTYVLGDGNIAGQKADDELNFGVGILF